jgi:hypothetical protein
MKKQLTLILLLLVSLFANGQLFRAIQPVEPQTIAKNGNVFTRLVEKTLISGNVKYYYVKSDSTGKLAFIAYRYGDIFTDLASVTIPVNFTAFIACGFYDGLTVGRWTVPNPDKFTKIRRFNNAWWIVQEVDGTPSIDMFQPRGINFLDLGTHITTFSNVNLQVCRDKISSQVTGTGGLELTPNFTTPEDYVFDDVNEVYQKDGSVSSGGSTLQPTDVFSVAFDVNGSNYTTPENDLTINTSEAKFYLGSRKESVAPTSPIQGLTGFDYNPLLLVTGNRTLNGVTASGYVDKWIQASYYSTTSSAVLPTNYVRNASSPMWQFDQLLPDFSLPTGKVVVMDVQQVARNNDDMLRKGVSFATNVTNPAKESKHIGDGWLYSIGAPPAYCSDNPSTCNSAAFHSWIGGKSNSQLQSAYRGAVAESANLGMMMLNWEAVGTKPLGSADAVNKIGAMLSEHQTQNYSIKLSAWNQAAFKVGITNYHSNFSTDYAGVTAYTGNKADFKSTYTNEGGNGVFLNVDYYADNFDYFNVGGYQNFPWQDRIIHHYLYEYVANKKYYPTKKIIATIWHDLELLPDHNLTKTRVAGGSFYWFNKPATPNQTMWNWGVWTVAVGDGFHLWSDPIKWVNDTSKPPYQYYSDSDTQNVIINTTGEWYPRNDMKNIDWLMRGVYNVSIHADIINASNTSWIYPSNATVEQSTLNESILVAYKLSADGTQALILAFNAFAGEGKYDHTVSINGNNYTVPVTGTFTSITRVTL